MTRAFASTMMTCVWQRGEGFWEVPPGIATAIMTYGSPDVIPQSARTALGMLRLMIPVRDRWGICGG